MVGTILTDLCGGRRLGTVPGPLSLLLCSGSWLNLIVGAVRFRDGAMMKEVGDVGCLTTSSGAGSEYPRLVGISTMRQCLLEDVSTANRRTMFEAFGAGEDIDAKEEPECVGGCCYICAKKVNVVRERRAR